MENEKRCPVGLDGFKHFCPENPREHESLEKVQSHLEQKYKEGLQADAYDWQKEEFALLKFIRGGCKGVRPKRIVTKTMDEPVKIASTISAEQQRALDDLTKLKAGIPFSKTFANNPHVESVAPEPVKPMTFEEEILHTWKTNPSIRIEFVSLASYQAFKRAEKEGRTRVVGNRIVKVCNT